MTVESAKGKEIVQPGDLYFLSHAGSPLGPDLFSGYGLTTEVGRKDRLTGLLMVDRPHPPDRTWLQRVEAQYGDYQLVPMTATGERGILAQMRVDPDSLPFLEHFSHPISLDLKHVLAAHMQEPPAPIFKMRWDEILQLWSSDFWIGLPPEMQAVFEENGYGCFAAEREGGMVTFVTHVAPDALELLSDASVVYDWQFFPMPSAPLIRFFAALIDDPYHPYVLENWHNIEDPAQAHCLARLVEQPELIFDFYGHEYEYAYAKHVAHPQIMRERLEGIARQASDYYDTIPFHNRNFDRAKALFQGRFPL